MLDLVIIGYGISGIVTAKNAKENNLNYIVLEKQKNLGGCWYNKAFYNTKLQTHKKYYQFKDYKINSNNDYPFCNELLKYFKEYVDINKLNNVIYNSEVLKCEFDKNNQNWNILYKDISIKTIKSKYLAICSGLFNIPNIPFKTTEKIFHNSELVKKDLSIFNNKNICIIGNGASSSDVINNLILYTKPTSISLIYRNEKWYVKRYIFGISISIIISKYVLKLAEIINEKLFVVIFSLVLKFVFGNHFKKPKTRVKYNNLIADDNILDNVKKKKIKLIKDEVLDIDKHVITKNYKIPYDYVIQCTGYKYNIPFLDLNKKLFNYRYIYNYRFPNCGFIGLDPSYNWIEVSTYQSLWFIQIIKGRLKLPSIEQIDKDILLKYEKKKKLNLNYNDLTYESFEYIDILKKEILLCI